MERGQCNNTQFKAVQKTHKPVNLELDRWRQHQSKVIDLKQTVRLLANVTIFDLEAGRLITRQRLV